MEICKALLLREVREVSSLLIANVSAQWNIQDQVGKRRSHNKKQKCCVVLDTCQRKGPLFFVNTKPPFLEIFPMIDDQANIQKDQKKDPKNKNPKADQVEIESWLWEWIRVGLLERNDGWHNIDEH